MLRRLKALTIIAVLAWGLSFNFANANGLEDEIGGLIIDRTITRFGKDFFQSFSSQWRVIKGTNQYTIAIIEKPLPQSGTVLHIEFRGQKVFQTFFGRRKVASNEKLAQQAISVVINQLAAILEQGQHPDLLGDGY